MRRTLEEILNTPIEFEEGMRVFSLYSFKFRTVNRLRLSSDYSIDLIDDNGNETNGCYMIDGKHCRDRLYRSLLTEQEAYELFPSLKPKVYEYQAIYFSVHDNRYEFSDGYYTCESDFKYRNTSLKFIKLYQPSKRERKS